MNYVMVIACIFIFMFQTISFKEFNKSHMKNIASYFLFNFIYFGMVVLILLALGGFKGLKPYTLWLGISFGTLFVGTILCYMKAMGMGPLSFTALFFAFGLVVPILYGLFFWNESISPLQLLGLLLLLITFYIGNESTDEDGEKKWGGKWLLFCLIAFVGNGGLMVISKGHQVTMEGQETIEFLVIGFGTAAVISSLLFMWNFFRNKQDVSHFKSWSLAWVSIVAGVSTAIGNWLALILSTRIPSVVQFPSINGGTVFLSTLASSLIFKEKLGKKAIIGLIIGLLALVLLSL
ncbi:MAG TPA: EamA family transporter [Clostridia bacterium]|nr:EamA family transporter [Clostridia bacterium]